MKITMQSCFHRAKHSHGHEAPRSEFLSLEPNHHGWMERLRARISALAPGLRSGLEETRERGRAAADELAFHVRRALAHSFETRIAVASCVVIASAVIGYQLGGRVIGTGAAVGGAATPVSSESLDDVLSHAEHAFDRSAPEGVDVEGGELVAQYAPVSIDALPVHQPPVREVLTIPDDQPTVERISSSSDDFTLVTRGELAKRETLGSALRREGVSPAAIQVITKELRRVFDFRRSRAGDGFRLAQASDGRVLDFHYSQGSEESYSLTWKGTRYAVAKQTATLESHVAKIAGVVDGSFYDAIMALGEQSALATQFAKILAWDMDFSKNVHPGDEFAILYERMYAKGLDGTSRYVRPGRILAGRYSGRNGEHTVVYYENGDGEGGYFRPDGSTIHRAFLKAPLAYTRISSRFTNARHHPILNITRPHPGIDYAAPQGTPIFSVGDGVVEFAGRQGASGNLVRIRHVGGYTSHYAHLSRFATGMRMGTRVKQRQVIGYVGSTGLSTGPHVCFRMKKNGHYVDPMRIPRSTGPSIDYDRIDHFRDVSSQRLADLGRGPLVAANEAL